MDNRVTAASTATPSPTDQRDVLTGLSIVSALVNGVQVPVACPAAWCEMDHADSDATKHVEDIDHSSANVDAYVPDFHGGPDQLFAYAHLGQDVYSTNAKMRAPHVRVEDGGGEASYLTPDQADKFVGNLAAFGSEISTLAQIARGMTGAKAGHHPWCEPEDCVIYDGEDGPIVEHHGRVATIHAPAGFTGGNGRLLHAYLLADDSFVDSTPAVSAIDATGIGTLLDGDALDELIDQTAAALNQLRAMRLQMKAAAA